LPKWVLCQGYLQQTLNRETLLLYGGVSKPKREAMIDRFQNDPQGSHADV
jgi:hypothetical protein